MIDYIIIGCPKLKSLSLESLRGCDERNSKGESPIMFDLSGGWEHWILKESLEELYKRCKDLKDLKFTKVSFENLTTEDAVKSIFPGCNVEIKNCEVLYIPEITKKNRVRKKKITWFNPPFNKDIKTNV